MGSQNCPPVKKFAAVSAALRANRNTARVMQTSRWQDNPVRTSVFSSEVHGAMQIFVGSKRVVARDWRPSAGWRSNVESKWREREEEGEKWGGAWFPEALVDGGKWGKVTRGTRADDEWEFLLRAPTLWI